MQKEASNGEAHSSSFLTKGEVSLTVRPDVRKRKRDFRCSTVVLAVLSRGSLRLNMDEAPRQRMKKRERALLDRIGGESGIDLAGDVIGFREDDGGRRNGLWLLLALSKPAKKQKKTSSAKKKSLMLYDMVSLCFEPAEGDPKSARLVAALKEEAERVFMASGSRIDRSKTILVLLNPKSGPGKAPKVFRKSLEPVLREAGLKYELVVTERQNHARDMLAGMSDLEKYSAVVIVSGDGLMFEAVQAISEKHADTTTPLGIVAGGSGNGLARSLIHQLGHAYVDKGVDSASARVAAGNVTKMDLMRMRMPESGTTVHAFLSFGVGIMADIDVESDVLRWMGESRFALWSLVRMANLKSYRARISYLHEKARCDGNCVDPDSCDDSCEGSWTHTKDDFLLMYTVNLAYISSTAVVAPRAKSDDGLMWLMMVRRGCSRLRLAGVLMGLDDGSHTEMAEVELLPVRAFRYRPVAKRAGKAPRGRLVIDGEETKYEPFDVEVLGRRLNIVA